MSDNWEFYACTLGDARAWISFDRGLATEIEATVPKTCVRLQLAFHDPRPAGQPGQEEFDRLNEIEDLLVPFIEDRGGLYAGRITSRGRRTFVCYAEISAADMTAFGAKIAAAFGYTPEWRREHDPEHRAYWDDLYPSPEDDSVIQDLKVIGALADNGDACEQARRVDHWAYFPSKAAAEAFVAWAAGQGYVSDAIERSSEPTNPYQVRFHRVETPSVGDFTAANILLRNRTRDLGGAYDGWETMIVKDKT